MSIDWGFALAELLVVLVLLGPAIVRELRGRRRRRECAAHANRLSCGICGYLSAFDMFPGHGRVCRRCALALRAVAKGKAAKQ